MHFPAGQKSLTSLLIKKIGSNISAPTLIQHNENTPGNGNVNNLRIYESMKPKYVTFE